MKKILLLFLLLPVFCIAQKIKVESEVDKFTKKIRIQTSPATIKSELSAWMEAYYRSAGDSYFITFHGAGDGVGVIGSYDKIILLLDNDSTVSLTSTGIQSYDIGYGSKSSSYKHQYYVYYSDLVKISQHNLKSVRKYYSDYYADIDVKEKRKENLKLLTVAFLNELNKNKE